MRQKLPAVRWRYPARIFKNATMQVFLATVKSSQKWLPPICGILCIRGNSRKRAGAFKKTSFMSLQSRRPVPEKCHSIMTWVIFCLRAVGLFACWAPQCKYPEALMQKKNWEPALSLALFCHTHSASVPRWLYGCSLLDISPLLNIPSPLPPPSHPPFSLPAIFCPAWLHAWPAPPWLLTSKRHFIHQSVIRKRGPFSSALKEREETRSEFIKKREGTSVWKEDMTEKEDPLLTAGNLEPQKQKRGCSCGYSVVELLSLVFFFCSF